MIFPEKLNLLRKNKGLTQEELAEKLCVSRQAIAKWESGQSYPDIANLIQISNLMNVTVDYLVRDQECGRNPAPGNMGELDELISFRLKASRNTYAAFMNETSSSRFDSHDYKFEEGAFTYYDTYLGGEQFAGQEAIWRRGTAVYAMNYSGRVLGDNFSGNFLKEALRTATVEYPYRGSAFYQSGEYVYKCKVNGSFSWFQGYEEIYCNDRKVYECYFHGGLIK